MQECFDNKQKQPKRVVWGFLIQKENELLKRIFWGYYFSKHRHPPSVRQLSLLFYWLKCNCSIPKINWKCCIFLKCYIVILIISTADYGFNSFTTTCTETTDSNQLRLVLCIWQKSTSSSSFPFFVSTEEERTTRFLFSRGCTED